MPRLRGAARVWPVAQQREGTVYMGGNFMSAIYRALNALRVWMVTRRFPARLVRPVSAVCVEAYYRWQYGREEREA